MTTDAVSSGEASPENAQPQAVAEDNQQVEAEEVETTEPENEEASAEEEGEKKPESDDEEFSKKAKNAISRRDKKIANRDRKIGGLQAELDHARREIQRLQNKPAGEGEPDPSKYPNTEEGRTQYWRDMTKYDARTEARSSRIDDLKQVEQERFAELEAARAEAINESATAAKEAFPDFEAVVQQHAVHNGQIPLSPAARSALMESDNGAFALYSILKSGELAELNQLTATRAAMLVARHEDKAIALTKVKKVSDAPKPMTPAKGAAAGGKDPSNMTDAEFNAWRRKQIAARR